MQILHNVGKMELVWIDDFLALEQTRNFTRAAITRATTQSAYSRRIQRLEWWLGTPLFVRATRPVELTQAGEDFLKRAARLREDILDSRRNALSSASGLTAATRIYTTNTLASGFFAHYAANQKWQNYTLFIASITGCLEALRQRKAHIAIIPQIENADDSHSYLGPWESKAVATDTLALVCHVKSQSHIHIQHKKISGRIMLYTPGTAYATLVRNKLSIKKITLTEPPICESTSAEALLAHLMTGDGAAWIPKSLIAKELSKLIVPVKGADELSITYNILQLTAENTAT